jgi:hypothetical protein
VFAIDGRYRFAALVGAAGGPDHAVRVAFGRTELADWRAEHRRTPGWRRRSCAR